MTNKNRSLFERKGRKLESLMSKAMSNELENVRTLNEKKRLRESRIRICYYNNSADRARAKSDYYERKQRYSCRSIVFLCLVQIALATGFAIGLIPMEIFLAVALACPRFTSLIRMLIEDYRFSRDKKHEWDIRAEESEDDLNLEVAVTKAAIVGDSENKSP